MVPRKGTCADETAWRTAADWRTATDWRTAADWLTAENPGGSPGSPGVGGARVARPDPVAASAPASKDD